MPRKRVTLNQLYAPKTKAISLEAEVSDTGDLVSILRYTVEERKGDQIVLKNKNDGSFWALDWSRPDGNVGAARAAPSAQAHEAAPVPAPGDTIMVAAETTAKAAPLRALATLEPPRNTRKRKKEPTMEDDKRARARAMIAKAKAAKGGSETSGARARARASSSSTPHPKEFSASTTEDFWEEDDEGDEDERKGKKTLIIGGAAVLAVAMVVIGGIYTISDFGNAKVTLVASPDGTEGDESDMDMVDDVVIVQSDADVTDGGSIVQNEEDVTNDTVISESEEEVVENTETPEVAVYIIINDSDQAEPMFNPEELPEGFNIDPVLAEPYARYYAGGEGYYYYLDLSDLKKSDSTIWALEDGEHEQRWLAVVTELPQ